MDWEEFEYEFVGFPWFEPEHRGKTYKAMKVLCERMPEEDKDRIPILIVFAPPPTSWGEQHTIFHPGCAGTTRMLYLSPELENRPQAYVNSTVAHEFAHAILNHDERISPDDPYQHERDADTLITMWGYRPTNSCGWMQKGKKVGPV